MIWMVANRSIFKGPEPKAIKVSTPEGAATSIANWVKGLCDIQQLKSHEICIAPVFGDVRSALAALNIPSLELQPNKADPGPIEPGVRLGAMRRIKGLEFKAVAMMLGSQTKNQKRLEHYVAATRARQWLLVVECR